MPRILRSPLIYLWVPILAGLAGLVLGPFFHCESVSHRDVDFVPTPPEVVDKMLELAEVKKDDVVYDLGCGDGRIVVAAAKKYGCPAVGVDIDPECVKQSRAAAESSHVSHLVQIEQADIFSVDLSKADVVTLYLLPNLNAKLIPQFEKMKPGSRIISHAWGMKGIKPRAVVQVRTSEPRERTIYLWTIPLERE